MKLSDLTENQIVYIDSGFICMRQGPKVVYADSKGSLCFECDNGLHYLDSQLDSEGNLIGVSLTPFTHKPTSSDIGN